MHISESCVYGPPGVGTTKSVSSVLHSASQSSGITFLVSSFSFSKGQKLSQPGIVNLKGGTSVEFRR